MPPDSKTSVYFFYSPSNIESPKMIKISSRYNTDVSLCIVRAIIIRWVIFHRRTPAHILFKICRQKHTIVSICFTTKNFKHNFFSFPSSQSLLHIPTGFASILVGMQEEWGLLSRINVPTIKSNIACTYIEAVFDTWDEVAVNCSKVEIISTKLWSQHTTVVQLSQLPKKNVQFPRGEGLGRKKSPTMMYKTKKIFLFLHISKSQ